MHYYHYYSLFIGSRKSDCIIVSMTSMTPVSSLTSSPDVVCLGALLLLHTALKLLGIDADFEHLPAAGFDCLLGRALGCDVVTP